MDTMQRVRPAQLTWRDHSEVARSGHRDYFERNGFTVISGLLSPPQVARAADEVDRIVAHAHQMPQVRIIGHRNPRLPSYDLEDAAAGATIVRKITGLRALSPLLCGLLVEPPELIDVLHALLGERVELYRDALMLKTARIGQEKPWHQDAVYWPFRPMRLISAMIALDNADAFNGCLQVIPGSHREIRAHEKVNAELQLTPGPEAEDACYVPLAAGDCLVFHSLLLHASGCNASDRPRRASICSYSPGKLMSLDPGQDSPLCLSERILTP
jgi:phytanoyl-CoA hydroxylase